MSLLIPRVNDIDGKFCSEKILSSCFLCIKYLARRQGFIKLISAESARFAISLVLHTVVNGVAKSYANNLYSLYPSDETHLEYFINT